MPSQAYESLLQMFAQQPKWQSGPVEEQRQRLEDSAPFFVVGRDVDVQTGEAGHVPCEWLTPSGASEDRVLYFLHGGGYCIGSLNTHRGLASSMARAMGMRALHLDYRLAPEHPFPAAVEDAVAGYRALIAMYEPENIVIAGDSAGGGLALATLIALRDARDPLPACAVVLSPWTDLAITGESIQSKADADPLLAIEELDGFAEWYLNGHDARDPLASPLYGDLKGLPPLLIHVGTAEVLLDDSTRLAERARAAGVDVTLVVEPEMVHVWHMFEGIIPEGRASIEAVGAWVRGKMG